MVGIWKGRDILFVMFCVKWQTRYTVDIIDIYYTHSAHIRSMQVSQCC